MSKAIRADQIVDGECFRKLMGSTVYRKISEGARSHYNLGGSIYGVGANGNMTKLSHATSVVIVPDGDLVRCPPAPSTASNHEGEVQTNRNGSGPLRDPSSPLSTRDAMARYRYLLLNIESMLGFKQKTFKDATLALSGIKKMVKEFFDNPERRDIARYDRRGQS